MSQPKRRAALMTGLASATVAILGLAPLAAHAQTQSYPGAGMAMPQAMMPPTFAHAYPRGGVEGPQSMPTMNQMPMMAPMRTYTPTYGVRPSYGQSYGFSSRVGLPSEPAASEIRPSFRHFGSDPGFYGNDPGRASVRSVRPTFPQDFRSGAEPDPSSTTPSRIFRPLGRIIAPVRPSAGGGFTVTAGPSAPPVNSNPPNNPYVYAPQAPVTTIGGPSLLGGYYYGGYCDTGYGYGTYPSVYSVYSGFPSYIYSPGVVYQTLGYQPVYVTAALPFDAPQYQVTYNQTNYYVTSEDKAAQIEDGGAPAKEAVHSAFPADSYQAAFADIERAWTDGNLDLIKNHLRSNDTKISVFLSSKYKYSLASSDFGQITRDALDRLDTVSFQFTRLRKAKNGDVTAYGKHVYRAASSSGKGDAASSDGTVPFDSTTPSADGATDAPSAGEEKTVYVSYTLRHGDDGWYITAVDSAADPLLKDAE